MQIKEINIPDIEGKIGYTFKDKSLLIQAFTRTSFCNEQSPSKNERYQSNEVLEFFGDGVLSVAIISFLMKECTERYPYGIKTDLGEGDFSNIKSKLSDKQNLSKSMKALGLQKYLRMGEGDAKLGIENEPSVMEDLFESIVGAIYIDSGMSIKSVIKVVAKMLDMSVYTDNRKPMQSAKNALQEWCADKKRRLPAPRYETLSEDGPDHKKTYMRGCYIGDRLTGRGIGKNFKLADAAAAEDALNTLMNEESANLTTTIPNNTPSSSAPTASISEAKNTAKKKNVTVVGKAEEKQTQQTKGKSAKKNGSAEKSTPDKKESNEIKNEIKEAKKEASPIAKLKAYASSQKKSSAVFKDLGEVRNGSATECRVECIFAGESTTGTGSTRSEARENSALLMVKKIGIGEKKKKAKKAIANSKKSDLPKPKDTKKLNTPTGEPTKKTNNAPNKSHKKSPAKRHAKARRRPIVKI